MKKYIILTILTMCSAVSFAQIKVTGRVIDESKLPMMGVTVTLAKGSGTVTNIDGLYEITVPSSSSKLTYNFLGCESQSIVVGSQTEINVELKSESQSLDEVVVIGYGTSLKKDLTGAVSSIKAEKFENKVMFSVDDVLSGGVAGLMVSSSSGEPGAASTMLIRGSSSLSGSTAPLIVVDGAPQFDVSTSVGGGISSSGMSGLSMVNPSDIASIEVLKDVSATSIYGNRGANGVILITTKKGVGSKTNVQYNAYFGVQNITKQYDMMDFDEYVVYQQTNNTSNTMFTSSSTGEKYTFDSRVRSYNWQDEVYRTGFLQNHNVSIQHSKEKTNFIVSGSYMQNKSILINTNWQKFTAKASVDHKISDFVKVGIDVNYNRIQDNGVPTGGTGEAQNAGVVTQALNARPYDLNDETTQAFFRRAGVNQSTIDSQLANYKGNPVNVANSTELLKIIGRTSINAYAEFSLLKDLKFKVSGYWNDYSLNDKQFYPSTTPRGDFYNTQAIIGSSDVSGWVNENILTWTPQINKVHRFNIMGGITEQGSTTYYTRSEFSDFETELLGFNNAQLAQTYNIYSSKSRSTYLSMLFRANYSYDSRYIATFTVRRDGTSSFVANKWGTFLSGALAWNISEEPFLRDVEQITTLKLRTSLGEVGNSGVPTTGSFAQLYTTNYAYGDDCSIGQSSASIANESLTWETTREWNIGAEVGLFDNRLMFNADYYIKTTYDLLLEAPVINIVGFDSAWQNIGTLRNRGIELSLSANIINHKDFKWDMSANFAKNNTEILTLGDSGDPIYLTVNCLDSSTGIIVREGGEIGEFYGYETIGVYGYSDFELDGVTPKAGVAVETGNERPGHMKFKDLTDDGKITADDRKVLGSSQPDFFGAFDTTFSWKNLNLNLGFQYSVGGSVYNANYAKLARFNSQTQNQMAFWFDRWSDDNLESTQYSNMTVGQVCSAFVEDASFLRFKTIRLTFSVPQHWFNTAKTRVIKGMKVYVACDNVYTFTRYSGYDPEVSTSNSASNMSSVLTSGFDYGSFPRARTFTAGLNINF